MSFTASMMLATSFGRSSVVPPSSVTRTGLSLRVFVSSCLSTEACSVALLLEESKPCAERKLQRSKGVLAGAGRMLT